MPQLKPLDHKESRLLKVFIPEASPIDMARMLRAERPTLTLGDAIFVANLLKEVHRLGTVRGKVVTNA